MLTPVPPSAPTAARLRGKSPLRTTVQTAASAAIALSILALPLLIAACGAQVEGDASVPGPPDQVVVTQDEYDYYPAYGVYFNPYRRQYYYQENGGWITAPGPPGVSVDVLLASPHVRTGFRDHPQNHHDEMVRRYPKNWSEHRPAGGHEEPERR
jgi:hypothetical protein